MVVESRPTQLLPELGIHDVGSANRAEPKNQPRWAVRNF